MLGRPDRFAWNDAVSGTCALSEKAHRSACNSRGAHRLFVVVVFVRLVIRSASTSDLTPYFSVCAGPKAMSHSRACERDFAGQTGGRL